MLSGGPAPAPRHPDLVAALGAAAGTGGGVTLVGADEDEVRYPWRELLDRARRVAGGLRRRGVAPGDRVAIVLPTGVEFLDAFFGAVVAGAVPVPLYPPLRLGDFRRWRRATLRMMQVADARLAIAAGPLRWAFDAVLPEALLDGAPAMPHAPARDDVAVVQFSSGTTVDPKPVALRHGAIAIHATTLLDLVFPDGARPIGVSWLPLYHDMGLVGCLLAASFADSELVLIPPERFLARPALWLRAIARHRAEVSPAPSFAYALCAAKIRDEELDGVDLSCWRMALDGAEQVSPAAARRFAERFARWGFDPRAIVPVYGLAEATLAVAFAPPGRDLVMRAARGREVASVGRPVPGVSIEIHDDRGAPLDDGEVGTIAVRGPSVTSDDWLDTGDLGFVADGELHVWGRATDALVIRGVNRDPAELEACVDEVAGVRPGCAVAVAEPGPDGEALILLVEVRPGGDPAAITAAIRAALAAGAGVVPDRVVLLAPGTLPRTSSGKLRRREALRRYLAGELTAPRRPSRWRLAVEMLRTRLRHAFG